MERPAYLIITTDAEGGVELFSAHFQQADAETVCSRINPLLEFGRAAFMIKVPEKEGFVPSNGDIPAPAAPPKAEKKLKPAPVAPRRREKIGARPDVMRDIDDPMPADDY